MGSVPGVCPAHGKSIRTSERQCTLRGHPPLGQPGPVGGTIDAKTAAFKLDDRSRISSMAPPPPLSLFIRRSHRSKRWARNPRGYRRDKCRSHHPPRTHCVFHLADHYRSWCRVAGFSSQVETVAIHLHSAGDNFRGSQPTSGRD